jgi:hypothetical protein
MKLIPCQIRPASRRALLVRTDSALVRLVLRLPMWAPVYVFAVRVGQDCKTYSAVGLCSLRSWTWR